MKNARKRISQNKTFTANRDGEFLKIYNFDFQNCTLV